MAKSKEEELEERFWSALRSDTTMMLGFDGIEDGHARPMTAQFDGDRNGPIWFFTSRENALAQKLSQSSTQERAIATFTSKNHELFATVHGSVTIETDRSMVDRLWNRFVAAWFEDKGDPKLVLLRLDPERAEIWVDASSLIAGLKLLIGIDPKRDYEDKVAKVNLRD
jgi:general stress protein 26